MSNPGQDPTLDIKIRTTADTSGAAAAEDALRKVGAANQSATTTARETGAAAETAGRKTAEASNEASHSVKELGRSFHEGAQAGRVLTEVAQGNIGALAHLGTAIRGIGVLLKTNLIGTLFTLGAIAAQVLVPIIRGFDDTKKKIEEAAKAAEALDAVTLESFRQQLIAIDAAATEAKRKLDLLRASLGEIDEAKKMAEIARIKADPDKTEEDKVRAIAGVEEHYANRAKKRAHETLVADVDITKKTVADKQQAAAPKMKEFHEALANQNNLEQRVAMKKEYDALYAQLLDPNYYEGRKPDHERDRARFSELHETLKKSPPPTEDELNAAKNRTSKTLKVATDINEKIDALLRELHAAEDKLNTAEETDRKKQPFEKERKRIEFGQAISEAKKKDAANLPVAPDLGPLLSNVEQSRTDLTLLNADMYSQGAAPSPELVAKLAAANAIHERNNALLAEAYQQNAAKRAEIDRRHAASLNADTRRMDQLSRQAANARSTIY